MFERYNEKARRTIFFARYEAAQFGSPYIETEHLLLGLFREAKWLTKNLLSNLTYEMVQAEIKAHSSPKDVVFTAVDLPLSNESKRVLAGAVNQAERLGDRHIGTEHLLLALTQEKPACEILARQGATLKNLFPQVAKLPRGDIPPPIYNVPPKRWTLPKAEMIEIHGVRWNLEYIRELVMHYTQHSWHWRRQAWTARDMVVDPVRGTISFDLSLASDPAKFELIKSGWSKDHCVICHWELHESKDDPQHNEGYTNGRDWLCIECFDKFFTRPRFSSSLYPEIT